MLNLERAKKSPAIFLRLVGISPQAFEELMDVLKKAYPDFERKKLSRRKRERVIGAGGKFKLSLEGRTLLWAHQEVRLPKELCGLTVKVF